MGLIGWALGIRIAYEEMVVKHGFDTLQAMLTTYTIVVAYLGGSLLVWAYYNFFRFHGIQRRQQRSPVTSGEQSRHYHVDPATLSTWTDARRLVMHHDAEGRIISADL